MINLFLRASRRRVSSRRSEALPLPPLPSWVDRLAVPFLALALAVGAVILTVGAVILAVGIAVAVATVTRFDPTARQPMTEEPAR